MPYLLDSNIFIQAKNLHYGFDFCPAFWEWIGREHANGRVYSIEKVRDELIGGDDEVAEWAGLRGSRGGPKTRSLPRPIGDVSGR